MKFRPAPGELTEIKSGAPEIVPFPGNVISISAEVVRTTSVYGRVVDASGAPMINTYLRSEDVVVLTDDQGYFVADLPVSAGRMATFADGIASCDFAIDLSADQTVQNLGDRACLLVE